MIVAGIGSRKGVSAADVLAAIDAALAAHGVARDALSALATTDFKRDEAGIFTAAKMLGLQVVVPISDRLSTDATPTPPSPLWGSEGRARPVARPGWIEGGGTQPNTLEEYRPATNAEAAAPPPPTPPHKGEGGIPVTPASCTQTLTHSPLSLTIAGTPSVSETAALIAAGTGAKLLGPRLAVGRVTCALAESETPS